MSAEFVAFASAFALIFAAELPDKTSAVVLVLTTRYRARAVLAGVAAAFVVHFTVAVLAGSALAMLPTALLAGVVAIIFGVGAYLILRESFRQIHSAPEDAAMQGPHRGGLARAALISFGALAIAELGDASQLVTAGLAAHHGQPLAVGLGAFAAAVAVATIAVLVGRKLREHIRPQMLQRVTGGVFACFAVLAAMQALA